LGQISLKDSPKGDTLPDRVADYEAREISAALARLGGSLERAATAMGIARRTLADKMARYGLRG
jgi:two-component system C4-dicarboxylate transport response regulator DctD